jgi:hypothetical protein
MTQALETTAKRSRNPGFPDWGGAFEVNARRVRHWKSLREPR